MRLWKKISIFVIYPILMLAVGFLASVKLHDFFYPSQNSRQEQPITQDVPGMMMVPAGLPFPGLRRTSRKVCRLWGQAEP